MFKIKCCTCNNESEITVKDNRMKIDSNFFILALA